MCCKNKNQDGTNFTNTRSPILSSLSPFLTDPDSDRLDTDSLLVRARLEDGTAGVVHGAFLADVVAEGTAHFAATLPTEGVGEAARDGGAVSVPFDSPSVRDSLDGRVKIPLKASHWK